METIQFNNKIHVLGNGKTTVSIIEDLISSDLQEEEEVFVICDVGEIVKKYKEWKAALPRIIPFYAVKCNGNPQVLKVLAALGIGFDCASTFEINTIHDLGVDPNRIIFANPAKSVFQIRQAASVSVDTMTFDSEAELHKIKDEFPNAKLIIRICCDDPNAAFTFSYKFGCCHLTEAPELLKIANELNLNVIGVSFHIGTIAKDANYFRIAIGYARIVFDYAETLGHKLYVLDIGGGYPGKRGTSINKIAQVVNSALDEYFPDPSVQVIAEPGRYFVEAACTVATIINSFRKREVFDEKTNSVVPHNMYFASTGVYGLFNSIIWDVKYKMPKLIKNCESNKLLVSNVWGPTCCSCDIISKNILLPELKIGDWIFYEDMGAYSIPLVSTFCGYPVPKTYVFVDKSTWTYLKKKLPVDNFQF